MLQTFRFQNFNLYINILTRLFEMYIIRCKFILYILTHIFVLVLFIVMYCDDELLMLKKLEIKSVYQSIHFKRLSISEYTEYVCTELWHKLHDRIPSNEIVRFHDLHVNMISYFILRAIPSLIISYIKSVFINMQFPYTYRVFWYNISPGWYFLISPEVLTFKLITNILNCINCKYCRPKVFSRNKMNITGLSGWYWVFLGHILEYYTRRISHINI